MSRRTKQIIAIILCITMVIGFDNVYGYRSVFKYINSVIVTKAGEVRIRGKLTLKVVKLQMRMWLKAILLNLRQE